MSSRLYDILVIGGGPSGVAMAAVAGRSGLATVVVQPEAPVASNARDGRAIALMASARDRLIDLDLWSLLEDVAWPLSQVRIHDGGSGHEYLYRACDLGRSDLFHGIGYLALRERLGRALDHPSIERRSGQRVTALHLDAGRRRATLDDGSEISARLVIGADGRRSTVRELVGLTARRTAFPQTALIFAVESGALEANTLLERSSIEGPISVLPLSERRFAVTWVDSSTAGERRRHLSPASFVDELARHLDLVDGADLELVTPVGSRRLGLSHADRYVAPRLALVGDAAHGAHPVHAQGFNMAIGDVHELAMLWRVGARRFSSAETLARFQRNRRLANAARLNLTNVMNRLFEGSTAPFAFVHGTGASCTIGADRPRVREPRTGHDDHLSS